MSELIPKHGGYRKLKSFQVAQLVYDVTVRFCDRYIDRRSRTHDQMVQAARSGVQNIAEGSHASATSKKTELYSARLKIQPQDIHRKAVAIFRVWIRTLRGLRYHSIGILSEYEPILKIFAIYS